MEHVLTMQEHDNLVEMLSENMVHKVSSDLHCVNDNNTLKDKIKSSFKEGLNYPDVVESLNPFFADISYEEVQQIKAFLKSEVGQKWQKATEKMSRHKKELVQESVANIGSKVMPVIYGDKACIMEIQNKKKHQSE